MGFIVSTDAAADLGLDYIKQRDIKVISMRFTLDGTEYLFGNGEPGFSAEELFDKLRKGAKAKSQLVNLEQHIEHFEPFLKAGHDVLHIPLSSALSGTAENAKNAAQVLAEKYPDRKLIVFNFNGASMGQGLFVDYLADLRDEGKTIDEAHAWAETHALKLCHYFTVDDLGHLKRGGRISGFSSFVGSILKIKPLLHVDDAGRLIAVRKVMGRGKALAGLAEMMKELSSEETTRAFICHADCKAEAETVADRIKADLGVTDITIGMMGPIIGLHSGPGTIALFFLGKKR